jgi:transcriptional regulator with XRE-family HTH domain
VFGFALSVFGQALVAANREGFMGYNEEVGERLRSIRRQRAMSLQDVHRATDGEFKAAVLGAYERGERSVSVPRLQRLAVCYDVPVTQLLPDDGGSAVAMTTGSVTIDLARIEQLDGSISTVIDRFLSNIQVQRQDFNGKVLTIRASDVALLSLLLDVPNSELVDQIRKQN